jgi:uncharacterized membrane protein YbhN (UPF0104 family)
VKAIKAFLSWFGRWFKWVALLATVGGIALALFSQWTAIRAFDWSLSWRLFLVSVLAFTVAPLVQGLSFFLLLRWLGLETRCGDALLIWSRSFLLRYAPSGALAIVIRVRERERLAATKQEVYLATAYEQLMVLAAGSIASVAAFLASGGRPPWLALGILVPALAAAVAIRPHFFGNWLRRLAHAKGIAVPPLLHSRYLAIAIALNTFGWLATGLATYVLVHALAPHSGLSFAWLTGSYALAWLIGLILPALPGGLGARDGMLIALLSARVSAGVASALAIALRLANTAGEFVAMGLIEGSVLLLRRDWQVSVTRGRSRRGPLGPLELRLLERGGLLRGSQDIEASDREDAPVAGDALDRVDDPSDRFPERRGGDLEVGEL